MKKLYRFGTLEVRLPGRCDRHHNSRNLNCRPLSHRQRDFRRSAHSHLGDLLQPLRREDRVIVVDPRQNALAHPFVEDTARMFTRDPGEAPDIGLRKLELLAATVERFAALNN